MELLWLKSDFCLFLTVTGRNLEHDIRSDTSGDFEMILVAMMQGNRDESPQVDMNLVKTDADKLYKAGEGCVI